MKKFYKIILTSLFLMIAVMLTGCGTNYEKIYDLDKDIKGTELTEEEYKAETKAQEEAELKEEDYKKFQMKIVTSNDEEKTEIFVALDLSGEEVKACMTQTIDGELLNGEWVKNNKSYSYSKKDDKEEKVYYELTETEIKNDYNMADMIEGFKEYTSILNYFNISVSAEGVEIVKDSKGNIVITLETEIEMIGSIKARVVFTDHLLSFLAYKAGENEATISVSFGEAKVSYPSFSGYEEKEK